MKDKKNKRKKYITVLDTDVKDVPETGYVRNRGKGKKKENSI